MDTGRDKNKIDPVKPIDFTNLEIFKNKRLLIVAGAILLFTVFGSLYSIIMLTDKAGPEQVPTQPGTTGDILLNSDSADMAEVLPQMQRSNEESEDGVLFSLNPIMDPFAEPMKLTGVVIGGRGGAMAIVESSGTSYIVSVGDYVDDLWAVYQITRGTAVLRAQGQEIRLYLDQPSVTRSLDHNVDEGGQEEGF